MTEASDETPTISAVMINHNGGERAMNTIAALCDQRAPLKTIVIVDNGSDDDSPRQITQRFPRVEVLALGENRGLPAARNAGLRHVNTDLVLMIDSDVYVEADCIEHLVNAMRDTDATIICPRVRLTPDRDIVQCDGAAAHFVGTMVLRHAYRPADALPRERTEVDGCIGACMLLDRRRVLDAGGFDELFFFYFEDHEFGLRLRGLGHRFVCEPAAVAYHDRGAGTAGLSFRGRGGYPTRRAYYTLRHRWLAMLIHYRLRTLLVLSPALLVYELASLGMVLLRGWIFAWLRAAWWLTSNLSTILRRRRRVQRARVARDKDLLIGGPIPLAPGVIRSRVLTVVVNCLSGLLNVYWKAARPLIG